MLTLSQQTTTNLGIAAVHRAVHSSCSSGWLHMGHLRVSPWLPPVTPRTVDLDLALAGGDYQVLRWIFPRVLADNASVGDVDADGEV